MSPYVAVAGAWGKGFGVRTATGALPATRFPGQWFQSESGLHQNWMRDYDPTTGRYIQADPLGLIDGASVYGYVKQNPARWIDPSGEYLAGGVGAGILADVLFPDPTDLVPQKWLGYAGVLALAWIADSIIDDSAEPDDASATPQQCTADDDCRSVRNQTH